MKGVHGGQTLLGPSGLLLLQHDPQASEGALCVGQTTLGSLDPPSYISQGQNSAHSLGCAEGRKKNSKIDPLKVQGLGVHYFSQLVLPQILMVLVQSMIRRLPKGD
jgi:hypothetical protein